MAFHGTRYEHFEQAVYNYKRRNMYPTCHNIVETLIDAQSTWIHALQSENPKLIAKAQKYRNDIAAQAKKCVGGSLGGLSGLRKKRRR